MARRRLAPAQPCSSPPSTCGPRWRRRWTCWRCRPRGWPQLPRWRCLGRRAGPRRRGGFAALVAALAADATAPPRAQALNAGIYRAIGTKGVRGPRRVRRHCARAVRGCTHEPNHRDSRARTRRRRSTTASSWATKCRGCARGRGSRRAPLCTAATCALRSLQCLGCSQRALARRPLTPAAHARCAHAAGLRVSVQPGHPAPAVRGQRRDGVGARAAAVGARGAAGAGAGGGSLDGAVRRHGRHRGQDEGRVERTAPTRREYWRARVLRPATRVVAGRVRLLRTCTACEQCVSRRCLLRPQRSRSAPRVCVYCARTHAVITCARRAAAAR